MHEPNVMLCGMILLCLIWSGVLKSVEFSHPLKYFVNACGQVV